MKKQSWNATAAELKKNGRFERQNRKPRGFAEFINGYDVTIQQGPMHETIGFVFKAGRDYGWGFIGFRRIKDKYFDGFESRAEAANALYRHWLYWEPVSKPRAAAKSKSAAKPRRKAHPIRQQLEKQIAIVEKHVASIRGTLASMSKFADFDGTDDMAAEMGTAIKALADVDEDLNYLSAQGTEVAAEISRGMSAPLDMKAFVRGDDLK